ncbi:hypothetical protein [Amycolatopsis sp. NPDC051371]|uniref:hypothetical protein n=1 Tax=Amycolatopsis sp. NPDC051371 TaxID=3155800 RepID=UPI003437D8AF
MTASTAAQAVSTSDLASLVDQIEALMLQEPPDWRGAFLIADAACKRLNADEAARTGRTIAEVEADARARLIESCRELWAAEDAVEADRA